jgi:hypothetical protein
MGKVFVTYKAPKGDDQIVEAFGHRFIDGMATELDEEADARAISKMRNFSPKNWAVTDSAPRGVNVASQQAKEEEEEDEEEEQPATKRGYTRRK